MANSLLASVGLTKAPSGETQSFELDLSQLHWYGEGALGPAGFSARARDLLEIARLVWEIEKHIPKRLSSDRVRAIELKLALREPGAWNSDALALLTEMLRLLGNVQWKLEFKRRPKTKATSLDRLVDSWKEGNSTSVLSNEVALFSGGLDSTCGLAWLSERNMKPVLVSFYGHKEKQRELVRKFGLDSHLQIACKWSGERARFGGQFQYRSLLFLSLAGALANSFGATRIYQFENGPLAAALPPSPMYRMTRHAHPRLHAAAGSLFEQLFGHPMSVENPFLPLTKREAVEVLVKYCNGTKSLRDILTKTETCWNLNSRSVLGGLEKAAGLPCGFCIPCLVRRTAIPKGDPVPHRIDFSNRSDKAFSNPVARVHVDAYLSWSRKMASRDYSPEQFEFDLPRVAREALAYAPSLSSKQLYELYLRFAREIVDTFPQPKAKRA
jgi:7-cyano-7-deazaguanine synthase in queuosine biosynthesis